jgi:hypothetical protein
MHLALAVSTVAPLAADIRRHLRDALDQHRDRIEETVRRFLTAGPSPTAVYDLESRLATNLRELGRDMLARVLNRLEGDDPGALPGRLRVGGEDYRLVRAKTRGPVDTVFGPIVLWRHRYRPSARDSAEPAIIPLERTLGVVANATPGLAEAAARALAEAGATQRTVQQRLRAGHGVAIGAGRLRDLAAHVSGAMAAARHHAQVARLLDLLRQADASTGRYTPVLRVGRDGVTLWTTPGGVFEVAATGTVTVSDRRGRRLGTVYLAFAPEPGQPHLTEQLTRLLTDVLQQWAGRLPRLAYITDAGENETQYYRRVLRPMTHPRTGVPLRWQRVLDFYHAMARVWALAEAVFGADTRDGRAWARKMAKVLKQPNGPFRVLHAAAAVRARRGIPPARAADYRRAYQYLRARTRWMQYHAYARMKVPLGSGVTEAACKTIVTQRLKLSGMRWSKAGAQVILDLRAVLVSGTWEATYRRVLMTSMHEEMRTPRPEGEKLLQTAA